MLHNSKTTVAYWSGIKRKGKLARKHRCRNARKWMPAIEEICRRAGVVIRNVEHGYQFRRDEYVLTWSPTTNRVSIQYSLPGHSTTVPFKKDGRPGRPRVLVALEELVEIVREENRPRENFKT